MSSRSTVPSASCTRGSKASPTAGIGGNLQLAQESSICFTISSTPSATAQPYLLDFSASSKLSRTGRNCSTTLPVAYSRNSEIRSRSARLRAFSNSACRRASRSSNWSRSAFSWSNSSLSHHRGSEGSIRRLPVAPSRPGGRLPGRGWRSLPRRPKPLISVSCSGIVLRILRKIDLASASMIISMAGAGLPTPASVAGRNCTAPAKFLVHAGTSRMRSREPAM